MCQVNRLAHMLCPSWPDVFLGWDVTQVHLLQRPPLLPRRLLH